MQNNIMIIELIVCLSIYLSLISLKHFVNNDTNTFSLLTLDNKYHTNSSNNNFIYNDPFISYNPYAFLVIERVQ